jgi:methionyl aminopeptidase
MIFERFLGRRKQEPQREAEVSEAFKASRAVDVVDFVSREVAAMIKPGITIGDIERFVAEITKPTGAQLYFKGYRGYPSSMSLPVNDEVVHTPPSKRILREGDLLKMEFGVALNARHAVVEWTFPIGKISAEDQALLNGAHDALLAGLKQIRIGARVGAISFAIHKALQTAGLSPSHHFVGYGIGAQPVCPPQIPCFSPYTDESQIVGQRLRKGMILAILVIAHQGEPTYRVNQDGWTVRTVDGRKAALFSRMVEVTDEGATILTKAPVFGSLGETAFP